MDKAYIVEEIKRLTRENGGVPPGSRRFRTETGIREGDWLGVHWARWSEALREAGFVPNELQGAYDKVELLRRYADLVLELGRLPGKGDLRLKARSDSKFPNDTTFARLGSKSDVVRQVVAYCQGREGYEEVVRLCEAYSPRRTGTSNEPTAAKLEFGSVYLIKSGKFYKIGRTNALGRRQYELSIQLPERAKTVHVITTDDPSGIEAYWHKRFEAKRRNGEWFQLNAGDIEAFKRRRFM